MDEISEESSVRSLIDYGLKQISRMKKSVRSKREVSDDENIGKPETAPALFGENFKSTIATGVSLVTFCTDWCTHCTYVSNQVHKLQKRFKNEPEIKFYRVDCALKENYELCFDELANGVPTTHLYENGKRIVDDYQSDSTDVLEDMVRSNIGQDEGAISLWKKREHKRRKARRVAYAKAQASKKL